MASAAFPFGIVPVRIQKYGYEPDRDELFAADSELQLTDGGVFDNSGLYGISSLLDYLTRQRVVRAAAGGGAQTAPRHIIILAINAEADAYDVYSAQGAVRSAAWYQRYPFNLLSVGLPIRTRALGISAINVIHYTNKRRAEELAVRQLASLGRDSGGREEVYFFPVNMAQLSRWDSNALPDPSGLYERYKSIPTRYAIDTKHHVLVSEAVELLVSTPQKTGWAAGKKCGVSKDLSESRGIARHEITRLDEALALTLLRPELDLAVDIGRAGLDSWQQGRCIRWNGEVVAAGPPG